MQNERFIMQNYAAKNESIDKCKIMKHTELNFLQAFDVTSFCYSVKVPFVSHSLLCVCEHVQVDQTKCSVDS